MICGPLGLFFLLLAFFSIWGMAGSMLLGLALFIVGIAKVYGLAKQKGGYDELNSYYGPGAGAAIIGLQFAYAFRRPRVFACWVTLEFFGMALLLTGGLLASLAAEREGNPGRNDPGPAPAPAPGPPTPPAPADPVEKALVDLDSPQDNVRRAAAARLLDMEPKKRRAEIARKLGGLIDAPDRLLDVDAVIALGVWGTAEEVPLLIKVVRNPDHPARNNAIESLGKLRDPRGLEAVAGALRDVRTRVAASRAVRLVGAPAEKAVLAMLDLQNLKQDLSLSNEVIDLLKAIGTQQSVPTLQQVAKGDDRFLKSLSEDALAAIAARGGK
jgi:hypothetical protein